MAAMMATSPVIPTAMALGGSFVRGYGAYQQGQSALRGAQGRQQALDFEADQLQQNAGQEIASAQVQSQLDARKTAYINSDALARAAASGAGASDPSVVATIARTAGEGAFRQAVDIYQGESQARLNMLKADAARYQGDLEVSQGKEAAAAGTVNAIGTALSGIGQASLYSKYFPQQPKAGTDMTRWWD